MAKRDEIIERVRKATEAERLALAGLLDVELTLDQGKDDVALANGVRAQSVSLPRRWASKSVDRDYRDILVDVVGTAASEAGWTEPEVKASATSEHLEEYIYRAFAAAHDAKRNAIDEQDRARLQEEADEALAGKIQATDPLPRWKSVAMGAAGGAIGGLWPVASLSLVAATYVLSPNRDKNLRTAAVLIHIRKRTELEAMLAQEGAA